MNSLGGRIKFLRNAKKWTQDEMADKLNLSLAAYSKLERNLTDVSYSRMVQIAELFGITVVDLISDENTGRKSNEEDLRKTIAEKDKEIIRLQKKIIEMLEEKR